MSSSTHEATSASVHRLDDYRTAFRPVPAGDDDEVWAEVLAAAGLFGALREAGLSVRFDAADASGPPRVLVTDLEGRTIRELAPGVVCDPAALECELLSRGG